MRWMVSTRNIDIVVEAGDQWGAFDSLRGYPLTDFGLVVEAQPVQETVEQAIAIRTSALFGRWGDAATARLAIAAAMKMGLPDTSEDDLR